MTQQLQVQVGQFYAEELSFGCAAILWRVKDIHGYDHSRPHATLVNVADPYSTKTISCSTLTNRSYYRPVEAPGASSASRPKSQSSVSSIDQVRASKGRLLRKISHGFPGMKAKIRSSVQTLSSPESASKVRAGKIRVLRDKNHPAPNRSAGAFENEGLTTTPQCQLSARKRS